MQAVDAQRFAMGSSNEVLRREQLQARLVKAALAQAPHTPVPLGEQVGLGHVGFMPLADYPVLTGLEFLVGISPFCMTWQL